MSDLSSSLAQAAAGMRAQAHRLRLGAENVANVDTPGYRRKMTDFRLDREGLVANGPVQLQQGALPRLHVPSHPMADEQGNIEGSNVDLIIEIADTREAQRSYEANLRLFEQARQMTRGLLEMLRR